MTLDGEEVPTSDASRWRDFAVDRGSMAWARELSGKRHYFEFKLDEATGIAQVKARGAVGDAAPWTCECGEKIVKGDPPLLLHNEDRGKTIDVQRRSLVLKGQWDGHDLELRTTEKLFRLQTEFRLRQELPDFW
jgi:topoisomerase IA-like protein